MKNQPNNTTISGKEMNTTGFTFESMLAPMPEQYTDITKRVDALVEAINKVAKGYSREDNRRGLLEAMSDNISTTIYEDLANLMNLEIKHRYWGELANDMN